MRSDRRMAKCQTCGLILPWRTYGVAGQVQKNTPQRCYFVDADGDMQMEKQRDIVFKHNKWGILEVYEKGEYDGVIATWPNPDEELAKALLDEIDRVRELKGMGIKPEPKDWSELFE